MLPAKNKFCESFRGVEYGQWIVEAESSASVSSLTAAEWSPRFFAYDHKCHVQILLLNGICFRSGDGDGETTQRVQQYFFFFFLMEKMGII